MNANVNEAAAADAMLAVGECLTNTDLFSAYVFVRDGRKQIASKAIPIQGHEYAMTVILPNEVEPGDVITVVGAGDFGSFLSGIRVDRQSDDRYEFEYIPEECLGEASVLGFYENGDVILAAETPLDEGRRQSVVERLRSMARGEDRDAAV